MRHLRPAAAMLAAAIMVSACGNTGPTPTPAPTPVPSATPAAASTSPSAAPSASASMPPAADVSAAFNKALSDPLFQSRITVKGTTTAAGITMPMEGTLEVRPGASHSVMKVTTPAGGQTTEKIVSGGHEYELTDGAWFDNGAPKTDSDLGALIVGLGGFSDTGIETKNGVDLHHMELPSGATLPAKAFGLEGTAMSNQVITLEAWAKDDGSPALMAINASWDQAVGATTVKATMTMEFAFTGVSVTIVAPSDLFVWRTSKVHKYRIAYPAEWEPKAGTSKKPDFYDGFDGRFVGISRTNRQGLTLNTTTSYIVKHLGTYSGLKSTKLTSNKAIKLDGVKARRLEYRGTYKGDKVWGYTILAVKGNYIWAIDYYLYQAPTDADLAQFATMLGTFSFK